MDAITGENLHFTNTSDLQGYPVESFEWDFGDGNKDFDNWDTDHAYSVPGTYTVTLTVTTECGTCTPSTETVNVHDTEPAGGIDPLLILAALALAGAVIMEETQ